MRLSEEWNAAVGMSRAVQGLPGKRQNVFAVMSGNGLSQAVFYYYLKKLRDVALDSAENKRSSVSDNNACLEIVSVNAFQSICSRSG